MSEKTILLIGGPDSGKTNFVGCLWDALAARKGRLVAPAAPERIKYVENALEHLLQGRFAPRTDPGTEDHAESLFIPVLDTASSSEKPHHLVVPDVTGELWKKAVLNREISTDWMDALENAEGILLFVRIGSDQNVTPLDWVTSARLLSLHAQRMAAIAQAQAGNGHIEDSDIGSSEPELDGNSEQSAATALEDARVTVPTQIQLCELIRLVEYATHQAEQKHRKRVALLVTAWDRLDRTRSSAGPDAYIEAEYPLLYGRLSNLKNLDVAIFGVSAVGGDFKDEKFRARYLDGDPKAVGFVVHSLSDKILKVNDLTLPIAWVLGETDGTP